jgi:hypothetical protein
MDVLQFIFSDLWHFFGTLVLIETIFLPFQIVFRKREKRKKDSTLDTITE